MPSSLAPSSIMGDEKSTHTASPRRPRRGSQPAPRRPHARYSGDAESLNLERRYSSISDAGGMFGGDGGVLQRDISQSSTGWLERLDRTPSRPALASQQPDPSLRHPVSRWSSRASREPQGPQIDEKVEDSGEDLEGQNRSSDDSLEDKFLVSWDGDEDPENPRKMSTFRKWLCTVVVSAGSLCVTCTSSMYSSSYKALEEDFHIVELLAVAGLSLFVIGLGVGPMFLAPLSEFYGRRPIYLVSFTCFLIFLIPCAVAPNMAVLLVFRFMTGTAGSAFLSVAGGTVGDMFARHELGPPMMLYTASPFVGPSVGPIVGGFINSNTTWRWTFYTLLIWSGVMLGSLTLFVPETYHPVLLRKKAQRMRNETQDDRYYAPIERMNKSILSTILWSCLRPFQLLFWEPMVLLLCIFTAILLGVLYLFFEAFPIVFEGAHGFNLWQTGLTFIGLLVGMLSISLTSNMTWGRLWQAQVKAAGQPSPEMRLPQAIAGSVLVTIGIFWFAWTTQSSVHWIVPIIASIFFGMGTLLVFGGVFTFLVDAYPLYAASAMAANSFVRSSFAGGFPLFGSIMYKNLGNQWATSLLGFLTIPMAPTMWLFYRYGARIRKHSRFAGTGGG